MDGFSVDSIDVQSAVLRARRGGSGPRVLLLHGHPRTHTTWWKMAPLLASAGFSVVCPDLRGHGLSRPVTDDYSKRAMASDMAARMRRLGFASFAVVGHGRGCYVAHRLAIEGPVSRLVVLLSGVRIDSGHHMAEQAPEELAGALAGFLR